MRNFRPFRGAVAAILLILSASTTARAQMFEAVGTRAQGMGGAFVAVVDDASATWWNPAGIGGGTFLSAIVERGQTREPADPTPGAPGWRNGTSGFAVAYPAMGLSYYRLRVSEIRTADSIATSSGGRQDQGTGDRILRSVATTAFGATVGQSLGNHVIVASTVRLLRAGSVVSGDATAADALDRAEEADVDRQTRGDLDLGVLVKAGALRVGGALKHVGEPALGEGTSRLVLKRQARAGLALRKGKTGVFDSLIGAVDVDLSERNDVPDAARRVAAGGEIMLFRSHLGLRYGVSTPASGERRISTSSGASIAFRQGLFVDGAVTPGTGASRTGWSVALRSSF